MKALSTTILIVVTAIVILVAALVVLTIFGGGIGTVTTLTNFRTQCITQCQITCKMGGLPPTWDVKVNVGGVPKACSDSDVVGSGGCSNSNCGGTSNMECKDPSKPLWCSAKGQCVANAAECPTYV